MRAGFRVLEENADFLGDLGTQSVLNAQSMLVHHIVVDLEGVMKQALGQAMATEGVPGARFPEICEKDLAVFET